MRTIKIWVAAMFLLFCSIATNAKTVKINGIWYNLISKVEQAEVTSGSSKYQGNIIIPSTVTYEGVVYNVTSIGERAFEVCSSLKTITLPESVTSIGDYAFASCYLLKSITIPDNSKLTSIGQYAFYDCCRLSSIAIPQSVTDIGKYAFSECLSLESVHISSIESWCSINFSHAESNPLYYALDLYLNGELVTDLMLPSAITEIKALAFYCCRSLASIIIPENSMLTSIGNHAFFRCENLATVTIPDNLKLISIGQYAFYNCTQLPSITIPRSVTTIGYVAFAGCTNLTSVHISSIESWCGIGFGSSESNPLYYAKNLYLNEKLVSDLIIPNTVTNIKHDAFYGCTSLTSVTIPESVTSIEEMAFCGCKSLTSVYINSIESWCDIEFGNNSNPLRGANLFLNKELVTDLVIPNTVNEVKPWAFQGCRSLTSVALSEGIKSIEQGAFYGCSNLASITIPEGVTSIGVQVFLNCSSLSSITIPESVMSISNGICNGCSRLNTVVIKSRELNSIGEKAFANCSELLDVYCYAEKVPKTDVTAFSGSYPQYATLHVLVSALENYKIRSPWNQFGTFETLVIPAAEIDLNIPYITITEGDSLILTATVFPDDVSDNSVCWSSSNSDVATVDDNGKVFAVSPGTAIITAAANDGSGVSASCEVTVEIASYVITYLVEGEVFYVDTLTRGEAITFPEEPIKEGYTFSGWGEVLEVMPAEDVTISGFFTVNKYLVTFKIGDEVTTSDSLEYGATIIAPEAPVKEGYTFDGWEEVAETVPASDVTYEGSYSVNTYLLIFMVDGETVQVDSVAYGTAITLLDEPTREGHTFSGWSEIPENMPANDITVSGAFTINKYLVTFKIDDEVVAADSLEYGATIVAPDAPEREGYTFDGWVDVVETVPANDVTIEGSYTANIYKVYYYVGEELVHTAEVTYGEAIPEYIYEPTEEGYTFLGWLGEAYETMPAHDVTYTANIESGINQLLIDNGQLTIYDLAGRKVLNMEDLKGGIYIVNGKKVVFK